MRKRALAALTVLTVTVAPLAACTSTQDTPAPESTLVAPGDLSAGRDDPVADPVYPAYGNPDVDVLHYGLAFTYEPDDAMLTGRAALTIRPVRDAGEVRLDLASTMTVDSATVDGVGAAVTQDGDDLVVTATVHQDQNLELVVAYHGTPHETPAPAMRKDMGGGIGMHVEADGSLWTMQEPYGAFTWYPVNDHPSDEALYDFAVTTPDTWIGVATGTYLDTHPSGAGYVTTRFQSLDPVASYLTTMAVDKFTRVDGGVNADGVRFVSWSPETAADGWDAAIARIPELVAWLEQRYGPYPFATAGVVLVGGQSGMETQGTITLSAGLANLGPDRTARVLLHELAHQWFGDSVTPTDWRGIWLNESVATYAEAMWAVDAGLLTEDEAVKVWRDSDQSLRTEAGPPGAYDRNAFASKNVYFCTALMLYELRVRLGPDTFATMLRDWVREQPNSHQDRASFTAWVNRYAGTDLTPFLDAWLDSPTTPTT